MTDEFRKFIEEHIHMCDEILERRHYQEAKKLQQTIINVFGEFIPNIDSSLDYLMFYPSDRQVDYLGNINKLRDKLRVLLMTDGKYSLDTKKTGQDRGDITINANSSVSGSGNSTNTNNNTNTVNATFDIKVALDKARKEIEENEYLDDDAKAEINEQLDQIESVMGEDQSNNDKWKKLKSVVNWVSNKGYKIGQLVMPLITKALFPDAE
ncbi:hypothetical protein [Clostridium butyricum]|uniref:hypothetical protein n=1 Tax=Clostridium butyricum TaxID=1492 RepID=UPI00374F3F88